MVVESYHKMRIAITDYQKARYIYLLNGLALKLAVGSLSEEDIMDIEQVMAIP